MTLDDRKLPSSGIYAILSQDIAGLGGQSHFLRETAEGKYYYPISDDVIGFVHSAGRPHQPVRRRLSAADRHLQPRTHAGSRLRPGGIGPRDITDHREIAGNGLGGTTHSAVSAETQFPIFGLPTKQA